MVHTSPPRLQFSLRWLFVIVAAFAVCAFVVRIAGLVEAAGVAVAFVLCAVCLRLPKFRFQRMVRGVLLTMATLIVWMVGVDFSDFWVGCDYCGSHWWVYEVRLFHQPIWAFKQDDHQPTLRLIAEDLGAPCLHNYQRIEQGRMWGLIWPSPFPFSGTCCLSSEDWYQADVRDHVRSVGTKNPALGREFQRALLEQDHKALKKLISEVRTPPDSTSDVE